MIYLRRRVTRGGLHARQDQRIRRFRRNDLTGTYPLKTLQDYLLAGGNAADDGGDDRRAKAWATS